MNKRTGWNRRWTLSSDAGLEILEDRLVLSSPSSTAWQPLLAKIGEYGKLADHLPAVVPPARANDDGMAFTPATILKEQISSRDDGPDRTLTDSHALTDSIGTQAHPLLDIERVIIGWSPAPANLNITDVQAAASFALTLFSGAAPAPVEAPQPLPLIRHEPNPHPTPVPIHDVTSGTPNTTPDPVPARERAKPVAPAKEAAVVQAASAPAEGDASQASVDPGANVAARMAAEAEQTKGPAASPPAEEDAAKARTYVAPAQDAGAPFLMANSFGQANLQRMENFDIHCQSATPEFIVVCSPLAAGDAVLEEKVVEPSVQVADKDSDSNTPAPVKVDLLLEFVPFDVAGFHAAFENFLTELEQICFGGGHSWIGMSLMGASLIATGLAGQTAWERMRRRRANDLNPTADDPEVTFLPPFGLTGPEIL